MIPPPAAAISSYVALAEALLEFAGAVAAVHEVRVRVDETRRDAASAPVVLGVRARAARQRVRLADPRHAALRERNRAVLDETVRRAARHGGNARVRPEDVVGR